MLYSDEGPDLRHELLRERDLRIGLQATLVASEGELARLRQKRSELEGLVSKGQRELVAHATRMHSLETRVEALLRSRSYRLGKSVLHPAQLVRARKGRRV